MDCIACFLKFGWTYLHWKQICYKAKKYTVLQACACTLQPGNLTGCGSEGVMAFLKKWRVWAWHETDYGQRGCHVASMFLLQSQTLLLIGRTSRGTAWSWEFPPSLVEVRVYGKTQQLFPVFCHKCGYVLVMYWLCTGDVLVMKWWCNGTERFTYL